MYTYSGVATGTFGGTPFSGAPFVVSASADTSQVQVSGTSPNLVYDIFPGSASISIAGFPTETFTDPTFFEDPNGAGDIIFGVVASSSGLAFCDSCTGLLGMTVLFQGLETYNLQSSFGPVSSPVDFESSIFDTFQNIPTGGGDLSLVASNVTFVAFATTPEPASLLIMSVGLLGMLMTWSYRRRYR